MLKFLAVINTIAILLFFFFLNTFKGYIITYMNKKGENLATKEDVAEITRKTENVTREFKEKFEKYSLDLHFKYDFYYKQYSGLYCKLYAVVMQSEYLRYFMANYNGKDISFDDAPFIEISPTHIRNIKTKYSEEGASTAIADKIQETPLSNFNKKMLYEYIIENGELATPELLKCAVSYRFAYNNYTGTLKDKTSSIKEAADEEEFKLIAELVKRIVKDYNWLRKELEMDYKEKELEDGIPTNVYL